MTHRNRRYLLLGFGSACLVASIWYFAASALRSMDMAAISSRSSPDGSMLVEHCRSLTDTEPRHHAPYGEQVFLRTVREGRSACTGTVIFAGYCSELELVWASAGRIDLMCTGTEDILTLMARVRGVSVNLERPPRRDLSATPRP